jgi:transposase
MHNMKFHSAQVRQVALRALERGETRGSVSRLVAVPLSTLDRWWSQFGRSSKQAAWPGGHKRAAFSGQDLVRLEAQLRACPDATLQQQAARWRQETGQNASRAWVQRGLKRLGVKGWTRKKRVLAPVSAMKSRVPPGASR